MKDVVFNVDNVDTSQLESEYGGMKNDGRANNK